MRLEMKLRCPERSTRDDLRLYVSSSLQQQLGCAALKTFQLVCLCQHVRCQPFEWEAMGRPYSQLTFRGSFSQADTHNWIFSCLPNVPDKVPVDDEISFYFRNDQWTTLLSCHYR